MKDVGVTGGADDLQCREAVSREVGVEIVVADVQTDALVIGKSMTQPIDVSLAWQSFEGMVPDMEYAFCPITM